MFLKCYRESSLGSSYDIKITEMNAKSSNYTVKKLPQKLYSCEM